MKLSKAVEMLSQSLEDGGATSVEAVESDTPRSKQSITDGWRNSIGSHVRLPHCRLCVHLAVSVMPTVPDAGKGFLTVQTVNTAGKVHTIPIERASGKPFAACKLENWSCGPGIADIEDIKAHSSGYFREQGDLCADFTPK